MNPLRKTIIGIISAAAVIGSVGAAVYAHDIPAIEEDSDTVEIQHPQPWGPFGFYHGGAGHETLPLSLDEAKEKVSGKLDKIITHLDEIIAKINDNEKMNAEQKEQALKGLNEAKEHITSLQGKISDADSLQELKELRKELRKDARHFMMNARKDIHQWKKEWKKEWRVNPAH